ncbi:MAG: PEP-CTERM sorting domain-containing protein, partial [Rubrivivax sp.]
QIYTYVGGSGVQGLHEVVANLSFTGVSFAAEAGYQITSVSAVVKGSYYTVGDAYGSVNIPAAVHWSGENYTATLALDPAVADLSIGFSLAASYLQGEDGTALSYGAGSASIDSLEFIVGVSPVPEPATAALLAVGGAMLPWLARRRRSR